SAVLFLLIREL
ncbi:hypothetical protein CP02DC16_1024B, partial [Chlamydia psittaci 02DC16]